MGFSGILGLSYEVTRSLLGRPSKCVNTGKLEMEAISGLEVRMKSCNTAIDEVKYTSDHNYLVTLD